LLDQLLNICSHESSTTLWYTQHTAASPLIMLRAAHALITQLHRPGCLQQQVQEKPAHVEMDSMGKPAHLGHTALALALQNPFGTLC
jgi:hypothetical protein